MWRIHHSYNKTPVVSVCSAPEVMQYFTVIMLHPVSVSTGNRMFSACKSLMTEDFVFSIHICVLFLLDVIK